MQPLHVGQAHRIVPIHLNQTRVYRYMHRDFVDAFFDTGLLRIKPLKVFKDMDDENGRGDKDEGFWSACHIDPEKDYSYTAMGSVANNSYILCASLSCDSKIMEELEVDDYLVINNPFEFCARLSLAIEDAVSAKMGAVEYVDMRGVRRHQHLERVVGDQQIDLGDIFQRFSDDICCQAFQKYNGYSSQHEFRFMWDMKAEHEVQPYLDVFCPDARQFCQRSGI